MDPVSHAALGAAWARPAAHGSRKFAAAAMGAAAGTAADLDFFIRSGKDPLLAVEFHRHFTHSLVFIPFGALICAAVLYPLTRRRLSFGACYLFSALGFASHGLLDACTSYGTLLFWPFSNERVALHLISVVDPLFTLPLIACVVLAMRRKPLRPAIIGLGWCLVYLGLGGIQHFRAAEAAMALAASRGHASAKMQVRPSFGNLLVWKALYEFRGRIYIDAVRVGVSRQVFAGESLAQLDPARDFPWLEHDSRQWTDVERFSRFAEAFLAVDPDFPARIVDVRYSLVPNRGDGFWALELDPDADAEAHAAYVTMRNRNFSEGRELLRMIFQGNGSDAR